MVIVAMNLPISSIYSCTQPLHISAAEYVKLDQPLLWCLSYLLFR